jgi:sugar lactone lactonase YvrE
MCAVTIQPILARPLLGVRSAHAEGPVYDPLTDELLWVDISAGLVNVARLEPELRDVRSYATGDVVGAVVPRRDPTDGWVVASRHGFAALDRSGQVAPIVEPERGAVTRMNDGKCDPFGGFWAGSMSLDDAEGTGSLYRLAPDGTCRRALTGVTVSNGLAWRDAEHVYYVDTPTRRVDLFTVTPEGAVTDRRPAFAVPADLGFPDGLTIDADGRLWVALWGGGAVACFAPDGEVLTTVAVDAAQVSCCTFAGPELATLVITTSQESYTPGRSAAEPWSGHLFVADVGARGLPPYRFG